jgi:hypothetical protein
MQHAEQCTDGVNPFSALITPCTDTYDLLHA